MLEAATVRTQVLVTDTAIPSVGTAQVLAFEATCAAVSVPGKTLRTELSIRMRRRES